jgi:hypothetical protein
MNFTLKQLERRVDRLQEILSRQTNALLDFGRLQQELEREAYAEVFGPLPEADPKNSYGDRWAYISRRNKISPHLGGDHLRLSEYDNLRIEVWWTGRGGDYDSRETEFKLDERIVTEEGRVALYDEYIAKYRAIKAKKEQDAREALVRERAALEKRLAELDANKPA